MKIAIYWFRRDLRLDDNRGLYEALSSGHKVKPIFIFDKKILSNFPDPEDKRVTFIHNQLSALKKSLNELGSDLEIFYGNPLDVYKKLISNYKIEAVFSNRDYEPKAILRDREVSDFLFSNRISFHQFKDHVIFEGNEILKSDNTPYTVYTPYKNKWLQSITAKDLATYQSEKLLQNFLSEKRSKIISLEEIGFKNTSLEDFCSKPVIKSELIKNYDKTRDFPFIDGTSLQGIHLRFGTKSIRTYASNAKKLNDTWLSELIWRDFFSQILFNFPHVEDLEFKEKYRNIKWHKNDKNFERWKNGQTGFPIVDAGMRELNATGHMHNRVRMITASFLIKDLQIDWRLGEKYFAQKLLDYDLASNNGNWQWASSSGCDAAPYFRIFNPESQQEKFDPDFIYVKKWVPEYNSANYVKPIVDHKIAREMTLKMYKDSLG